MFGLVAGCLYALAGLGLVIVYRASRVLNFALPGIGTVALYVGQDLLGAGVPYPVVFAAVVLLSAVMSALVQTFVVRYMEKTSTLTAGTGTLGVLLILQGFVGQRWGYNQTAFPPAVHGSFQLAGVDVPYNELAGVLVAVGLAAATVAWLGRTRSGAAMRATSAGPVTAELIGVDTGRLRLVAWGLGGAYGAIAALFIVPQLQLDTNVLLNFVLVAFAAVVMGGFLSPIGVLIGGVTIGLVISFFATYVSGTLTSTFTFLVIAGVLLVRPQGLVRVVEQSVQEPAIRRQARPAAWARRSLLGLSARRGARSAEDTSDIVERHSLPTAAPRAAPRRGSERTARSALLRAAAFVVVGVAVGLLATGNNLFLAASVLASFVAVCGLTIVVGDSGQLSIGQGAFVAVGAYALAYFTTTAGVPFLLAVLLSMVVSGVVAALVGVLATRLVGIYLSVFTLAFALLVPEVVLLAPSITGGAPGLPVLIPQWAGTPRGQYFFTFAVAALVAAFVTWVRRAPLGRSWRAVRDSEAAAIAVGYRSSVVKLGVFACGGLLAGLGGSLSASLVQFVAPDTFDVFLSIYLLVAVLLGGSKSIIGSLIGAAFITLLPYYAGASASPSIIFGVVLLAVLFFVPTGIWDGLLAGAQRLQGTWAVRRPRTAA